MSRGLEKENTNPKEDLEQAITNKQSALVDRVFDITNAVQEAKLIERRCVGNLLHNKKAKATKLKAADNNKVLQINVRDHCWLTRCMDSFWLK